jgi:hypothetical protein
VAVQVRALVLDHPVGLSGRDFYHTVGGWGAMTVAELTAKFPLSPSGGCTWYVVEDGRPALTVCRGNGYNLATIRNGWLFGPGYEMLVADILQLHAANQAYETECECAELTRLKAKFEGDA